MIDSEQLRSGETCTVVVPCYNEADRLPVQSFRTFIPNADGIKFLFVNDGSRDNTLAVLQALQGEFPQAVDVLNQVPNKGKAEAVRSGMLHAITQHAPTYTGFWDADLATPLSELPRLLGLLSERPAVEMLLGSRVRLLGRSVSRKSIRHYSGRIFATLASLTLDLPVYDTQCGAKLFRVTPALDEILSTPFHSRWIFDVELIARYLQTYGANRPRAIAAIYEEPLQLWEDVSGSKLQFQDSIKALGELWTIRTTYTR